MKSKTNQNWIQSNDPDLNDNNFYDIMHNIYSVVIMHKKPNNIHKCNIKTWV